MSRSFNKFATLGLTVSLLSILGGCQGQMTTTATESKALEAAAPLVVIAIAKVRAGAEEDFKDAAMTLASGTRQEPGNLAYVVHQAKDDPTRFAFYERWATPEASEAHMHGAALDTFFRHVSAEFEPGFPQITRYAPVDSSTVDTK